MHLIDNKKGNKLGWKQLLYPQQKGRELIVMKETVNSLQTLSCGHLLHDDWKSAGGVMILRSAKDE